MQAVETAPSSLTQGAPQGRPVEAVALASIPRTRLLLWLLAGVVLLAWLGTPPVRRTQEARVLETARQMLGTGVQGWMLPNLNGVPRLQKPPLTYWMAAVAFKVGGVNEFAGRVPFVLLAWGTLGLTYAAGRRFLRSEPAALLAAATLLGTLLFIRNSRLAETDGPATFFVTLGIYAFWRAATDRRLRWFHVGALGVAGAVMSKGPPGAYPILFLLLLPLVVRDRGVRVLLDFLRSGALVTILLLAVPWYAYVYVSGDGAIVGRELDVVVAGEGHSGAAYKYIPALGLALLPWTGAVIVAFCGAVAQVRRERDAALRGLLLWTGAVILPLLLIGQKQIHYLLPAMPPIALIFGWAITARDAAGALTPVAGLVRVVLAWSLAAMPAGALAVLVIARMVQKTFLPVDFVLATAVLVGFAAIIWACRRRGAIVAIVTAGFAGGSLVAFAEAWWMPNVDKDDARIASTYIRKNFPNGPYCFYGANLSVPLCFDLRQSIPLYRTPEALAAARERSPDLIVMSVSKPERKPPEPPGMVRAGERLVAGEAEYRFFRAPSAAASEPALTTRPAAESGRP